MSRLEELRQKTREGFLVRDRSAEGVKVLMVVRVGWCGGDCP